MIKPYWDVMGFDPRRPHKNRPTDYVFVVAAIVVAIGLMVWAFFG